MSFIDRIGDVWKSAFDPVTHGFLSGSSSDFQMGIDKFVNVLPHAFSNSTSQSIATIGQGVGSGIGSVLAPINYSPAGYLLIGGGIIALIIGGYISYKILKYV